MMRNFLNFCALIPLIVACSSSSSGDKAGVGASPGVFNLSDAPNVVEVDLARLQSGLDISTTTLSGNKLYRFSLPREGSLGTTGRSALKADCNGDADAHWSLRRVSSSNAVEAESLGRFTSGPFSAPVSLQAGTYFLVFESAPGVTCSTYSLGLTVRAQLSAEPANGSSVAGSSNPGTGTSGSFPSSGSTSSKPSQPKAEDPEQTRIRNGELKDTAGVTFFAYASPSEGCVPVLTRTVADLKKNLGLTGPVRLIERREEVLKRTDWKLELTTTVVADSQRTVDISLLHFNFIGVEFKKSEDLRRTLLNDSGMISLALDAVCASRLSFIRAENPFGFRDFPLWSKDDDHLPLNSFSGIPDARFTYRTINKNEYLEMKLGIKRDDVLRSIRSKSEEVTAVDWMLGDLDEKAYEYYPISDWQSQSVDEFLSGQFLIKADSLAPRAISHFRNLALALRIKTGSWSNTFILPVGKMCQDSYTRTDGAAYHKALFNDLTHPEWNDKPNMSEKTGCAFIGGVR